MTGSVTILRCQGRDRSAAKRFELVNGSINKIGFSAGMFFSADVIDVSGLYDLGKLIVEISRDSRAFIIRGVPLPGAARQHIRRLLHRDQKTGDAATIADRSGGERWVVFDYDGMILPEGRDLLSDPDAAIAYAVSKLPEAFRGCSHFWQLSSSAGFTQDERVLKAHVFFYFDRGVSREELRAYFNAHPEAGVDKSVFTPNQPIYTAAPILGQGITDPVKHRFGYFNGDRDEVTLPAIDVTECQISSGNKGSGSRRSRDSTSGCKRGQEPRQHQQRQRQRGRSGHSTSSNTGDVIEAAGFEAKLSRLGDSWIDPATDELRGNQKGNGFRVPLLGATASYVFEHGRHLDREVLKALLRLAISEAPVRPGRDVHDIECYSSDTYLDDFIETAIEKFAPDDNEPIDPTYPAPFSSVEEARVRLAAVGEQHVAAAKAHPAKVKAWNAARAAYRKALDSMLNHCGGWLWPAQETAYWAAQRAGLSSDEADEIARATSDPLDDEYNAALARYVELEPGFAAEIAAAREAGGSDKLWGQNLRGAVLGVAVDVGVGKTTMWRERVAPNVPHAYLAVPRHKLGDEIVQALSKNGIVAHVYRGLEADDPDQPGEKMCQDIGRASAVFAAGGDLQTMACGPEDPKKPRCAFRDRCGYQRQRAIKTRLWIIPHQMLFRKRPDFMPEPGCLTIDESFYPVGLRGFEINDRSELLIADLAPPIDQSSPMAKIRDAFAASSSGRVRGEIWLETGSTSDLCEELSNDAWGDKMVPPVKPGMLLAEAIPLLEKAAASNGKVFALVQFWKLAADSIRLGGRSPWLELRGDSIRMRWRCEIHASWLTGPVLAMDATMPVAAVRAYLPNLGEVPELRVAMPHVFVRQIRDKAMSKSMMVTSAEASPKTNDERRRNIERLRWFIEVRAAQHPDVLVICQLDLEVALKAGQLPPNVEVAHFNDITGIDRWRHVSLLIVVGRTEPDARQIEARGRALFGTEVIEIAPDDTGSVRWARTAWGIRLRDGTGVRVEGNCHPDAGVEELRWAICEGGLLQAIGRARGVNRTAANPLSIDILTNICLPIVVDEVMTWDQIQPSKFEVAASRAPAMPLSDGELARCYPDLWSSKKAVEHDRVRAGWTGPSLLTALATASFTFVMYRRAGQPGSASEALVAAVEPDEVQEALENVVGPVTQIQATSYHARPVGNCIFWVVRRCWVSARCRGERAGEIGGDVCVFFCVAGEAAKRVPKCL